MTDLFETTFPVRRVTQMEAIFQVFMRESLNINNNMLAT